MGSMCARWLEAFGFVTIKSAERIRSKRSLTRSNLTPLPLPSTRIVRNTDPQAPSTMNDTSPATPESGSESEQEPSETRRARSIRFSDSEWESVERAATERGMNAAEFARHAALSLASGQYGDAQGPLPPQYTNLIERIFRSTHILVSLKRDEMIREGRGDELDELIKTTRELRDSLIQATHKAASTDAGTSRS